MENELPQDTAETQRSPEAIAQVEAEDNKIKMIFFAIVLAGIYSAYKTKGSIITKITSPFIYGIILLIILSYTFFRSSNEDGMFKTGELSFLFDTMFLFDGLIGNFKLSWILILLFSYLSYTHRGTILGLGSVFVLLYGIYYRVRVSMILKNMQDKNTSNYDENAYIENVKRVQLLSLIITLIIMYKYIKHYNLFR